MLVMLSTFLLAANLFTASMPSIDSAKQDVSSETYLIENNSKIRVKRDNEHDWNKPANPGIEEGLGKDVKPEKSVTNVYEDLKKEENKATKKIQDQIKILDDANKKVLDSIDEVEKNWSDYDYKFEKLLRKGNDFGFFPARAIKWYLETSSITHRITLETYNGLGGSSVETHIEDKSYSRAIIPTRSYLTYDNNLDLIRFPSFEWQHKDHYVPYTEGVWSTNMGTSGWFKNYMGPVLTFNSAITYIYTEVGEKYDNGLGGNVKFGIGLYYDGDRKDMNERWQDLKRSEKEWFNSVRKFDKCIEEFRDIINITKDTFEHNPKFEQLNWNQKNENFIKYIGNWNDLMKINYSFKF